MTFPRLHPALFLLVATLLYSQEPTFRSRTELVTLPVVVTRHGQPVRGLKKDDFQLFHNGKPEPIAVFEQAADRRSQSIAQAPPQPNTVQNYSLPDEQDVVIILLDFTVEEDGWVSDSNIRTSLDAMGQQFAAEHTPVSVFLLTRPAFIQVHSFTQSPEDLTRSVDAYVKYNRDRLNSQVELTTRAASESRMVELGGSYLEQVRLLDTRLQTNAVTEITKAFRGLPGRKKLIWMSSNFFHNGSTTPNDRDWMGPFKQTEARQSAMKLLNDANIAVYPLDSRGVMNPTWDERFAAEYNGGDRYGSTFGRREKDRQPPLKTLSLLEVAKSTGGQTCTDLPARCIKKIQADGNEYYVLGFYLPKNAKPGWHNLKVESKQSDLSIRARAGFQVTGPPAVPLGRPMLAPASVQRVATAINSAGTKTPQPVFAGDEVLTALAAPLDYSSIPLRMKWNVTGTGSTRKVELLLNSPPGGIAVDPSDPTLNLDILAYVRETGNVPGNSFPESLSRKLAPPDQARLTTAGFAFRKVLDLPPGRYGVRLFVRDNVAHKIGTVSAIITVK